MARRAVTGLLLAAAVALLPHAARAQAIDPAEMPGTWSVIAIRNVATGEVDSISQRRTIWLMVTLSHWSYVWMDHGRPVTTADSLAALPPDERRRVNYAKIWDERDQPRFWASGGEYRIVGNRFVIARAMSIEPAQQSLRSYDEIVQLDRTWYVYRTTDRAGLVREWVHRRLD